MLTGQAVSRFLVHPQRVVRDHALRCLASAGESCGATADAALAAMQQLGAAAFSRPEQIARLPQTQASIDAALQVLAGGAVPWAARVMLELPQVVLPAHASRIPAIRDSALRAKLQRRLQLAETALEQLWEQLVGGAGTGIDDREALILALVPHDGFCAAQITPVLGAAQYDSARELAAVQLAGRTRFAAAAGDVVARLASDDPALAEAAVIALGQIGTAGAVTLMEQRCIASEVTVAFRLQSARALAHFRVPSLESVLLRLLGGEDDPGVSTAICAALSDICASEAALAAVNNAISAGRCGMNGGAGAELRQALAAVQTMLSAMAARPSPGGPSASTHAPTPQDLASAATLPIGDPDDEEPLTRAVMPRQVSAAFAAPAAGTTNPVPVATPLSDAPSAPPLTVPVGPLKRDAGKVGRNDPCPCGSGKKYKKCCGA